jgi:hypothetical protein
MKNLWIKGLSGFALAFVAQAALAVPVVITSTATTGPKILATSQIVVTPTPNVLALFNGARVNGHLISAFTAENGATTSTGYGTVAFSGLTYFRTISFNAPVASMTYESTNLTVLEQTVQGSIKITSEQSPSQIFIRGGELTIKDMRIDHNTKTVYATVIGANGVGTRQNVPFWTYTAATGHTTFPGGNIQTTLNPIRMTNDGLNAWVQSLGLTQDGRNVLTSTNNSTTGFGNIAITVNTTVPSPEDPACKAP